MSVTQIAPRPVPMEAFFWDGSESGAQAIALWLIGHDGPDAWNKVNYHRESQRVPTLTLQRRQDEWGEIGASMEVDVGDWVVRFGSIMMTLDQETFDYYFTASLTLVIQ